MSPDARRVVEFILKGHQLKSAIGKDLILKTDYLSLTDACIECPEILDHLKEVTDDYNIHQPVDRDILKKMIIFLPFLEQEYLRRQRLEAMKLHMKKIRAM